MSGVHHVTAIAGARPWRRRPDPDIVRKARRKDIEAALPPLEQVV